MNLTNDLLRTPNFKDKQMRAGNLLGDPLRTLEFTGHLLKYYEPHK